MGLNGRKKRVLDEKELEQLKSMSGLGMPIWQMAAILGLSDVYLEELIKKSDAAQHAIALGRAVSSHTIRVSAYMQAQTDPVMMKFWLKTREGFREVDRVEITGKDGEEIKVMTVDERKKQFAKVIKALEITKRMREKNGADTE